MQFARRTAVLTLALLAPALAAQNSTQKLRVPPTALAEGKEKHKLVFWYVPTVTGSPMDRRPEIDGYLMAGPFSWPSTIDLLSQSFVPVKQAAKGEAAKRYQLQRMKF